MLDKRVFLVHNYIQEAIDDHIDRIRNFIPTRFTRNYKVSPKELLLQMLHRRGQPQWAEMFDFSEVTHLNMTEKGFFCRP